MTRFGDRCSVWLSALALWLAVPTGGEVARAQDTPSLDELTGRLIRAYPSFVEKRDGNALLLRGGVRIVIDDGIRRGPAELIASPDIKDMFRWPYPRLDPTGRYQRPEPFHDPGRARNQALFDAMYGNCREGGVVADLVDVSWLPSRWGRPLRVTRTNGVAQRLKAVSDEIDRLPRALDRFLIPPAGAYHCRPIAGTGRPSPHGWGIAIDLALGPSHYWRWGRPTPRAEPMPPEIVAIFERHGFIWGGRWHHVDTMHFEYRPELLP